MASGYTSLKQRFIAEIETELHKKPLPVPKIFTENAIAPLPVPIRKYLRSSGFIGKPVFQNARIKWKDTYLRRDLDQDWMQIDCYQFNAVAEPTRIVYIKAGLFGFIPFEGRDKCQDGHGNMLIKLLKLVTVADAKGKEMDASALVTVLAETLLVPGYIFQNYISWSAVDATSVTATLRFNGTTVSGTFYFNDQGEFCRFETLDRYLSAKGSTYEKVKWTALAGSYQEKNGMRFPSAFKAIWNRPQGDFEYFKGTIEAIDYDITAF